MRMHNIRAGDAFSCSFNILKKGEMIFTEQIMNYVKPELLMLTVVL